MIGALLGEGTTGMIAGTVSLTAVPIPAAAWLFGAALLGIAGLRGAVAWTNRLK